MTTAPLATTNSVTSVVGRRSRGVLVARAAVLLGAVAILGSWVLQPVQGGDTGPLLTGTEALGRCLANVDLVACDDPIPIGPYPLLQYVPDLAADAGAQFSEEARRRVLAMSSILGVVVALLAAWVALRRLGCPELRWFMLLAVLCGPVVAYGGSTWGEMLAMGLVTMFVALALIPARPILVGLAAFGASLTKETGYPFVVALGLVALFLARRRTGVSIGGQLVFALAGVGLGVALTAAFNILRFGTPRNAYYLDSNLRNASPEKLAELAAGLVVSPNGGLVFFWPLPIAILVAVASSAAVHLRRGHIADAWPGLAPLGVGLALTIGLASWWSPFGWWAWGPRLSLPWVVPLLLLALAASGPSIARVAGRLLGSRPRAVVLAGSLVALALPHVGFLWRADTVLAGFFLRETAVCPGGGPPPTAAYYECLREQMWSRHPIMLDALSGLATPGGFTTAVGVGAGIVGVIVLARAELAERAGGSEPSRIVGA